MSPSAQYLTTIKLRGRRRRRVAEWLLQIHRKTSSPLVVASRPAKKRLTTRIVCISDTHNKRPEIVPGDVLIHAGDLTENGSFDEVQDGLTWLSSQPHRYKILVAGNHDVLLDEEFLSKYPERRYGDVKTKEDLDWGSVIYLQDSIVTLEFPRDAQQQSIGTADENHEDDNDKKSPTSTGKKLTVFGSPWTPQYGVSAFQYRPDDHQHWDDRLSSLKSSPDVIVTHGPPRLHLDAQGFHRAGCPYFAAELSRIRPRLVVFGHIHASYGREDVVLDAVQRAYEDVMAGWAGWEGVVWMGVLCAWARVQGWFARVLRLQGLGSKGKRSREKVTTFVNAAVVGGKDNKLRNEAIVFEL